jgi:hypothetical protein
MLGIVMLTACSGQQPADQSADAGGAQVEPATSGVTREEVAPPPAPVAAPAPAAIQTQPGPKGAQVSLNRVAVTGDIMTVALTYSGGECCVYTPVDKVSAIDDATSQRLGVLKDNAGNWMAAPLYSNNTELRIEKSKESPVQVWFKFPAPPATTKTVSITVPEVAPFDAVPVAR